MKGKKIIQGASTVLLAGALATSCAPKTKKAPEDPNMQAHMDHYQQMMAYYEYLENEETILSILIKNIMQKLFY